jgi:hypothetical protein
VKSQEHDIQVSFFRWCKLNAHRHPALACIFAIPNGGHRDIRTAARLKAEGVRAGVWDVFLPCPSFMGGGMFIEFKSGKNKLTDLQSEFWTILSDKYAFKVAYSWPDAARAVETYLGLDKII